MQGNIINSTEEAYTISGRIKSTFNSRFNSVTELHEPLDPTTLNLCNSASPSTMASSPVSCSNNQSSEISSESPSDIDSLDSELIRVAIENFELDEDDFDALYDISILDYETGLNHSIKVILPISFEQNKFCDNYRV